MDGQSRNAGTFPLTWALLDAQVPVQNDARHPAPSSAYPREWSLSTVPESVSDETETQRAATTRGDFPIALSDLKKPAFTATTPSTFETNWALPANADSERDAFHHSPHGKVANASWSPGVPGNFKHQGYSNLEASPASRPGPSSSESANVAVNGVVRRVVGYYNNTSSASAISGAASASPGSNMSEMIAGQVRFGPQASTTSPLSPWVYDSSTYRPPRPAGFTSNQITPHSTAETDAASAELYHPPRPAGFGPGGISSPISSSVSAQSQQSASDPVYNTQAHAESLPAIYERRELGREFAPITIPDQAGMLPGNVSSWLLSDADQLYKPPAAPLTATAPWRPAFQ